MPKNLGRYDNDLSVPRKKDIDDLTTRVEIVEEAVASKQDTITGGASTITDDNLTANRALVSDGSGKVAVSTVTSTELGYLDGVTSNVQTQLNKIPAAWTSTPKVEGYGSPGTSTQYARGDHVHPKRTLYEAELQWGGGSIKGGVTPIDAAMMPMIGYNKTDCAKPEGITVEYSNDAGETWVDYGLSDRGKSNLVSMCGDSSVFIGGGTSLAQKTLDDKLRITVNAQKCGTYTALKKILIEMSTNGATDTTVLIEKAKGTAPEDFTEIGTYNITGWSGWNSIDIGQVYFGGGTEQNMWVLRFTFSIGGLNTGKYTSALQIMHILFLGNTNWGTPSAMARTGHLYTYDVQQNAVFPANVKAAAFTGSANGLTSTFDTWSVRENITSGENLTTIFSKIKRMFTDLKALAFKDKVDKADLSDAVQASLNKADTALQTAPVTSVNNKTGAVTLDAADVGALPNSTVIPVVNDATLNIQRNGVSVGTFTANASVDKTIDITVPTKASDVGALPDTTSIPSKTSELDNDSGYITVAALNGYAKETDIPTKVSQLDNDSGFVNAIEAKNAAPVQSIDGATGAVVTNAVKTTAQILTDAQKTQARNNIGAGTSSFSGSYNDLNDKPTIPTKTSDLDNDNGFITAAQAPVTSVNTKTGEVTLTKSDIGLSNVDNVKQYSTSNPPPYPVTSVNGQTGAVTVDVNIPDNLVKYTAMSDVQSVDGLNADTLEGHNAAYFATASGLSVTNTQVATNTNNIDTLTSGLSTANNNISVLQTTMANKLDKSGGTMTGALVAQNNTNYTTAQVRNIIISTADPSGGSNGDIWIKYTP